MATHTVIASPKRNDRWSVECDGQEIVSSSRQPFCEAARVLHARGAADNDLYVCRNITSEHVSFNTTIGRMRGLSVSEQDRGVIRFAKWAPNPMFAPPAREDV